MQRLIDANAFAEKIKEISDKQGYNTFYTDKQSVGEILNSVVDDLTGNTIYGYENCPTVLTLPDNTTNGDMIKALFPNIDTEQIEDIIDVYGMSKCRVTYDTDWWNAPYKAESENT